MRKFGHRAGKARRKATGRPGVRSVAADHTDLKAIERAALAGTPYDDIIGSGMVDRATLTDPIASKRLQERIETLNTQHRVSLRLDVKRRIKERSVNTLSLAARNDLGWDQPTTTQQQMPDLSSVATLLTDLLTKHDKQPQTREAHAIEAARAAGGRYTPPRARKHDTA